MKVTEEKPASDRFSMTERASAAVRCAAHHRDTRCRREAAFGEKIVGGGGNQDAQIIKDEFGQALFFHDAVADETPGGGPGEWRESWKSRVASDFPSALSRAALMAIQRDSRSASTSREKQRNMKAWCTRQERK